MKRHNVMLDPDTVARAQRIGMGNLSKGLRDAVSVYTLAPSVNKREGKGMTHEQAQAIFDSAQEITSNEELTDAVVRCDKERELDEHLTDLVEASQGSSRERVEEVATGLAEFLFACAEEQAAKDVAS